MADFAQSAQVHATWPTLEPQLKRKLDRTGIIYRLINRLTDHPETAGRIDVLLSSTGDARQEEMRVVEEIEELRSEIQSHALPGQREMFNQRKISVHKPRSVDGGAGSIPKFASGCFFECTRIKPIGKRVNLSWRSASRVGCNWPRLVGITDFVRALQNYPVVEEEDTRFVGAIDHEQREAGLGPFDDIHLPISQHRIGSSVPVATKVFALAKGQLVEHAGGETVVEI